MQKPVVQKASVQQVESLTSFVSAHLPERCSVLAVQRLVQQSELSLVAFASNESQSSILGFIAVDAAFNPFCACDAPRVLKCNDDNHDAREAVEHARQKCNAHEDGLLAGAPVACCAAVSPDALAEVSHHLLQAVFLHHPQARRLLFVGSAAQSFESGMLELLDDMQQRSDTSAPNSGSSSMKAPDSGRTAVYVAREEEFLEHLSIRAAREEDYDDIAPLLSTCTEADVDAEPLAALPAWTDLSTEYALSRLLTGTHDSRRSFVLHNSHGNIIAFAALSRDVDVDALANEYDTSPFDYLRESEEVEVASTSKALDEVGAQHRSNFLNDECEDAVDERSDANALTNVQEGGERTLDEESTNVQAGESTNEETKSKLKYETRYGSATAMKMETFRITDGYEQRYQHVIELVMSRMNEEFCVACIPHGVHESPVLRSFTRVEPIVPHPSQGVLYVLHGAGLLQLSVRACSASEAVSCAQANHLELASALTGSEIDTAHNVQVFVAMVADQPIGFGLLTVSIEDRAEHERLNTAYDFCSECKALVGRSSASVDAFALHPVMLQKEGVALSQMLAAAGVNCATYETSEGDTSLPHYVKSSMIQAPRRLDNAGGTEMHVFLPAYASSPKFRVNSRIVVIGASEPGIRALQDLVWDRRLRLPELQLIAPGSSSGLKSSTLRRLQRGQVDMQIKPTLFEHVVELNREDGLIWLESGKQVPFETLLFAAGLEDDPESKFGAPVDDCILTVEQIAESLESPTHLSSVFVLGTSLRALEAITLLLQQGVPPGRIQVICSPEGPSDIWHLAARAANVAGASLLPTDMPSPQRADVDSISNGILTLALADGQQQEAHADLVVQTDVRSVPKPAFSVLNDAGIVLDSRVVVDASLRTNDPRVRAAGKCARFSRRCGASIPMESCSGDACGVALAATVSASLLPKHSQINDWTPLEYLRRSPVSRNVILPTWLNFAHCGRPLDVYLGKERECFTEEAVQSLSDQSSACIVLSSDKTRRVTGIAIASAAEQFPVPPVELRGIVGCPRSLLSALHAATACNNPMDALQASHTGHLLRYERFSELRDKVDSAIASCANVNDVKAAVYDAACMWLRLHADTEALKSTALVASLTNAQEHRVDSADASSAADTTAVDRTGRDGENVQASYPGASKDDEAFDTQQDEKKAQNRTGAQKYELEGISGKDELETYQADHVSNGSDDAAAEYHVTRDNKDAQATYAGAEG